MQQLLKILKNYSLQNVVINGTYSDIDNIPNCIFMADKYIIKYSI